VVGHAFPEDLRERTTAVLIESELGITAIDEKLWPAFNGLDVFVSDTSPVMVFGCRDNEPQVIASEFLL